MENFEENAGHNLTATLLAIYCMLGLGEIRMSKMPVIILSDAKIVVAAVVLAIIGLIILLRKSRDIMRKNGTKI